MFGAVQEAEQPFGQKHTATEELANTVQPSGNAAALSRHKTPVSTDSDTISETFRASTPQSYFPVWFRAAAGPPSQCLHFDYY